MNKKFVQVTESVVIDKLVPGGQGIGTLKDGRKVFLWNALPGETVVEFTTTKVKSHYLEGYATKIDNPSPHRIAPKDDCYLSTSPWQIMDYHYELEQKKALLIESFRQEGITITPPTPQTDDHDFFYRNKMEYSLYYDIEKEQIFPAMRLRGTHRKVPLTTSSIERPEIWQKALEIINNLNKNHVDSRQYQSLLLRCDQSGHVEGGLYENYKPHPTFNNLQDTLLGHEYSYSPNGFFQINLPVYEMALMTIKKYIETDQVLDLYSGVGTIGLSVASDKDLTLVEVDKFAYQELEKNATEFISAESTPTNPNPADPTLTDQPAKSRSSVNLTPTNSQPTASRPRTILAKSEEVTTLLDKDQTVILDPPRAGLDRKLTDALLETSPARIIYLSCNPSTQARDVRLLTETGKYDIIEVIPFNFFPRTPHLENLLVLEKHS